jgi:hypothetical protein
MKEIEIIQRHDHVAVIIPARVLGDSAKAYVVPSGGRRVNAVALGSPSHPRMRRCPPPR